MNIKEIRKKLYLTQKSFAEQIGISLGAVSSWEQGKRNPNLTQQRKIAELCKKNKIKI